MQRCRRTASPSGRVAPLKNISSRLGSIMGDDYSPTHVRVRPFDAMSQAMFKDKIDPGANGLYWDDPQKVHLKCKCTGMPITLAEVYCAPPTFKAIKDAKGHRNYQHHTIKSCKVQLAEQRETATVKTKREVIDMYMIFRAARAPPPALVLGAAGSVIGGLAMESRTVGVG